MLGDEELVWGAIRDLDNCQLTNAEKALLRFVEKANGNCAQVSREDVDALLTAGWTEEAVYDAVSVCALFNFYNRWVDATGVQDMPPEHYRRQAQSMARSGYARD